MKKDIVKKVIEYILTLNLAELSEVNVNKIADKFEINTGFLSRKFKKTTDLLLSEYINFNRIQKAQSLLKTRPDLSIPEISEKIGIKKCQQFRTKFKKVFGINPHHYRIEFLSNLKKGELNDKKRNDKNSDR